MVEVLGQQWAVGIEPSSRFEGGWARSLHEDYTTTEAYLALVKTALVLAGEPRIETLVTGQPGSRPAPPRCDR
ncbi:MAG TPA: hypothetical protein VES73_05690 [Lamprocystis sp. (in: g-proteobacteria)]|nr:hypothetical protein [Lamprocystis sp. (in: g-proteobacteria)]